MGVAELIAAFNQVAEPRYSASKGLMSYLRASDTEWQILTFSGIGADGAPFEVRSDRLRPGTNIVIAAGQVAQTLLDQHKEPSP